MQIMSRETSDLADDAHDEWQATRLPTDAERANKYHGIDPDEEIREWWNKREKEW